MMLTRFFHFLACTLLLAASAWAQNNNAVTAGEFIVEPATLHNLGFEWKISGDDNRNATVAVQYRKVGETNWREALPLLRIGDEKVGRAQLSRILDAALFRGQHSRCRRKHSV